MPFFSGWRKVNSGVLQGSVLSPVLFNILINNLKKKVLNNIAKFAHKCKLLQVAEPQGDGEEFQKSPRTELVVNKMAHEFKY